METPYRWFFGYGSLVNDDTLAPGTVWQRATLQGWRRVWGHSIERDPRWLALNAVRDDNTAIDGLLIRETADTAGALAAREAGYSAVQIEVNDLNVTLPADDTAWIWSSNTPAEPGQLACLCQSYIDCVLAGFDRHFGANGIARFVASTNGWQRPVIADRGTPRYPRAVTLTPAFSAHIDMRVDAARQKTPSQLRE